MCKYDARVKRERKIKLSYYLLPTTTVVTKKKTKEIGYEWQVAETIASNKKQKKSDGTLVCVFALLLYNIVWKKMCSERF